MIGLSKKITANIFRWDREYLFRVLTEGKNAVLHDPLLINALRLIDRKDFVRNELKDRAYEDVDLDMGYGETFTRPTVIAQSLQLLKPRLGGKYLDLGTGSGYVATVLGFIAGQGGYVYSIERIQWLWELARQNISNYKDIKNVKFLYRNGSSGLPESAPFDGIHVSFTMDSIPNEWIEQLSPKNGVLVVPFSEYNLKVIERNGDNLTEELVPGFVFQSTKDGVA